MLTYYKAALDKMSNRLAYFSKILEKGTHQNRVRRHKKNIIKKTNKTSGIHWSS